MVGKTLARYEIQSEIGRGGMAAVYLAHDPNFRRNVAIKVVSVNFQDNLVFRGRFEREAHLIAKIEHPAIVPVYDYGEQDDQPYLVMRYMPGGSLAGKIKEGALTFRDATQIISQIARLWMQSIPRGSSIGTSSREIYFSMVLGTLPFPTLGSPILRQPPLI